MKNPELKLDGDTLQGKTCSRVQMVVDHDRLQEALDILESLEITQVHVETGRTVILDEQRGIAKALLGKQILREDQSSVIHFCVEKETTRDLLQVLCHRLSLDQPGTGSIFARTVVTYPRPEGSTIFRPKLDQVPKKIVSEQLSAVMCIVQLGEGNKVGTIGLNTGTAVPTLSYGTGTGLRNRLGAWRILIPAQKEVACLVLDTSNADTVMDMMIEAGSLDQPGKGFIYQYPIEMGILETRFSIEQTRKAASIEQIISAIDELKGTTAWRRKAVRGANLEATELDAGAGSKRLISGRPCLTGLAELTIFCNEGYAEDLTQAAMNAGASGATMHQCKHIPLGQSSTLSPAREVSNLTVSELSLPLIMQAVVDAGLFDPSIGGEIQLGEVGKAFTFLGKS